MKLFAICVFLHAMLACASLDFLLDKRKLVGSNATALNTANSNLRTHPFDRNPANSTSSGAQWTNFYKSSRRQLQQSKDSRDAESDSSTTEANSTHFDSADEAIEINSTDLVVEIEMNISNCKTAFMIIESDSTGCESTGTANNLTITDCERAFVKIVVNTSGCDNAYATIGTHGNDTESADDSADDNS